MQITAPHSSADRLGPSPQGLLLWEVQPARQSTAWLPSSCRVREGCPPSCHPRSREERALMRCLHDGIQSQPGRVLCRQHSLLIHTVTVVAICNPPKCCPCAVPGSLDCHSPLLLQLLERRGACRKSLAVENSTQLETASACLLATEGRQYSSVPESAGSYLQLPQS